LADEHERIQERERGHQAKLIVEHHLWAESWEKLDALLMNSWRNSRPGDAERRENIYLQLDAARVARKYIEEIMVTGQLAEMQLQERSNNGTGR